MKPSQENSTSLPPGERASDPTQFRLDGRELLTPQRLDLILKYLFFRSLDQKSEPERAEWESVYRQHILDRTGGVEPPDLFRNEPSPKQSVDDYVRTCESLLQSFKASGFDASFPIPVFPDGTLQNGAHRLACALAANIPVEAAPLAEGKGGVWDFQWFLDRCYSQETLAELLHQYARLSRRATGIIIFWGPTEKHWPRLTANLQSHLNVVGWIDFSLEQHPAAFESLVHDIYSLEWQELAQPNIRRKVGLLRQSRSAFRVVLVEQRNTHKPAFPEQLRQIRDQIRQSLASVVPVEHFCTCHASTTDEESRYLIELLFGRGSRRHRMWRPYGQPRTEFAQWLFRLAGELKQHGLSRHDICIVGSSPLEVIGIRNSTDIDITVSSRFRKQFGSGVTHLSDWLDIVTETYGRAQNREAISDDQLIHDARYHFWHRGFKFAASDIVLDRKALQARPKDLADVESAAKFFATTPAAQTSWSAVAQVSKPSVTQTSGTALHRIEAETDNPVCTHPGPHDSQTATTVNNSALAGPPKFISFLLPYIDRGQGPIFHWIMRMQAALFGPRSVAFIGDETYFRPPLEHGQIVEQCGYRYLVSSRAEWDSIPKLCLPRSIFADLERRSRSMLDAFRILLTEDYPPLREALQSQLAELCRQHSWDAVLSWCHLPSLKLAAEKVGLPVIHNELGPLRAPLYQGTAYFDFQGVNGFTSALDEMRRFAQEARQWKDFQPLGLDALRDLLIASPQFRSLTQTPAFAAGVALQVEDDSNLVAFANGLTNFELIFAARRGLSPDQVLIRHHPAGHARYSNKLGTLDRSKNSIEFLSRCQQVHTTNSSVAFECLLQGKPVTILGDSPAAGLSHEILGALTPDERLLRLNWLFIGHLVPAARLFDADYYRWRISRPSLRAIYERHLADHLSSQAAREEALAAAATRNSPTARGIADLTGAPDSADIHIATASVPSAPKLQPFVLPNQPTESHSSDPVKVSIIVPVHNNLQFTSACLDAIARNTPTQHAYEVVVVDDASDDGTDEFLRQASAFHARLRSVRLSRNGGFSRACNAGAKAARGEFLLFLNNDTQPCPNWLDALLDLFSDDPQIGVAGSLLLFPRRTDKETEPDRVQHCGIAFNDRKESLHLYKFCHANQPFIRQSREYQAITGASLMIPRELFEQVGGFGEDYLNGAEDLDLCFKVRAQGRKAVCCADSVIRHFESATIKSSHTSTNANYRLFLERWGNQIQSDEDQFYTRDGIARVGGPRIAMVAPLRPLKTGVADYVEELLPSLTKHARVDFFVDDFQPSSPEVFHRHFVHSLHDLAGADWTHHYDAVIYHIGNNNFHGEIYKLAANRPGIVVLHEYDCRGCGNELSSRKHLRGLLNRSKAVIVHNEHSRRLLHQEFPNLPISVIPHLLSQKALKMDPPDTARARLALPANAFTIVSLGLVQFHKRNHITLEAFARFAKRHPNSLLLLAGEAPDPTFRACLSQRIQESGLQNRVRITGWLSDEQFFDYLSAADVTVNLRYPARGEESGSLTRILGCGKPAIVSNYAQFADIPDDCVIKVNFENEIDELVAAWEQLLRNPADREQRSARARDYYRAQNNVDRVATLYARVCAETGAINETTLQLRQPRYRFPADKTAKLVWSAPIHNSNDFSRPLILALDRLSLPVRVEPLGEPNAGTRLINSEDHQRINELSQLPPADEFIQVFAGVPAQFRRHPKAAATVAITRCLDTAEARAWTTLPVDEFWAGSCSSRDTLVSVGVPAEKIAVIEPGVSALSYGATVTELRPNGLFRFLCVTDWTPGSGWESVVRAFLREFHNPVEAQLILKCALTHLPPAEKGALYQQTMSRFLRDHPEFRREQFALINGDAQLWAEDLMPSFYSAASALVQPTLNGSGRRAILEASALGLPVITTALGQVGSNPFIVPSSRKNNRPQADEARLQKLMREVVTNRLDSQLSGLQSRLIILRERTWESIAQIAAERLARLLERNPTVAQASEPAVPQTSKSAVPQVSKPARRDSSKRLAGSETCVTAGLETRVTAGSEVLATATAIQLRWQSPIFDPSGYADEARYLLRHTHPHFPVRLEPIGRLSKIFRADMDPSERAELDRLIATPTGDDFIQLTIAPAYALKRNPKARYAIGRTTFETDRLAPDWVAACNGMDEIWVPTEFNVETFHRAGVVVPIHIVPQGVDAERFRPGLKPLSIPGRRRFAFLSVFEWIHRKGWDILLRAWADAFRAEDDVCLIIRSYLPNVTEGDSSTEAIEQRINDFFAQELKRPRSAAAPIIVLGEQLPQLDMPRLYASADAFVLPTRGEGWGRPFIEAMACGLPVIGTRWSAQLAFMHDQNSLLLNIDRLEAVDDRMEFPFYRGHQWARPSVAHLQQLLQRVVDDPIAARKLGEAAAAEVRNQWTWQSAAGILRERLASILTQTSEPARRDSSTRLAGSETCGTAGLETCATAGLETRGTAASKVCATGVVWEGSFHDNGSLSHVNRELTRELENLPDINLTRTPTDKNSGFRTPQSASCTLTVRHSWPPNWTRPAHGKLVVIQPWEFGPLPDQWVKQARDVDEFWVPTRFVRECYVQSGIAPGKVHVVPNGIDPDRFRPDAVPRPLATRKKFKFLFVSATIGRKGPDVLLNAWLKTFTAADDVCLVIKDFGGDSVYKGQTIAAQIKALQQQPNVPEILYLNEELAPEELPGLYTACDCLVHPYRGEGFGLPVLEAMACGLPVIVTGGGATDDFATDEFAYRIPSTRRTIGREVSGIKLVSEGWLLEPDLGALCERMRWITSNVKTACAKGRAASEHARTVWTWQRAAGILRERLATIVTQTSRSARRDSSTRLAGSETCGTAGLETCATAGLETRGTADSEVCATIPPCARLGQLTDARAQLGRRDLAAAWTSALAAIQIRPFHPEAWLLLAEIAAAAGNSRIARTCAQRARDLAPNWKAAKQFLKKPLNGNTQPDWLKLPDKFRTPKSETRNRLTVCVITKNEDRFLAQCLNSVKDIADQILVLDTGSTDRTIEIAKAHGAEVHQFAWCDDFSAARNAALEHISGDWILMLDADEELPSDQHALLRADLQNVSAIGYRVPLINHGDEAHGQSFVPRLFRNVPGAFYYGRIHEQIFPSLLAQCKAWGLETALGNAQLLHHGYTKELVRDRNKIERNLKLLRLAIAERPDDANLQMNLGLELVRSDDLAAGLVHYRRAFDLMSARTASDVVPELREVLLTQFAAHLYKVRDHQEVVDVLTSPLAQNGGLTASLHFALGLAQFERRQYAEAAKQMRLCLKKRKDKTLAPINTDILTVAPQHCLAMSLAKLNDPETEKTFQAALAETIGTEAVKLDYARWLAGRQRPLDALQQLNELVQQNGLNIAAWRLGAEIALSKAGFLEFALDWTGEAIRCHPDDLMVVAQRAEALLLSQQIQPALPLWERACNCERPPRAVAARILCATVASEPVTAPGTPDEELAASRAFVDWYRKLLAAGARDTIVQLNSRVDTLRSALPSAARLLEAVVAETAA